MKLFDIKTKSEIKAAGRRVRAQKARVSANDLNPIEWSKWLFEIRQHLGSGMSRAQAYEDCREHYENHLLPTSNY